MGISWVCFPPAMGVDDYPPHLDVLVELLRHCQPWPLHHVLAHCLSAKKTATNCRPISLDVMLHVGVFNAKSRCVCVRFPNVKWVFHHLFLERLNALHWTKPSWIEHFTQAPKLVLTSNLHKTSLILLQINFLWAKPIIILISSPQISKIDPCF